MTHLIKVAAGEHKRKMAANIVRRKHDAGCHEPCLCCRINVQQLVSCHGDGVLTAYKLQQLRADDNRSSQAHGEVARAAAGRGGGASSAYGEGQRHRQG